MVVYISIIISMLYVGIRQTFSDSTHFIDGSPFYGSHPEVEDEVREFVGGKVVIEI
jgi:hypothetical protein